MTDDEENRSANLVACAIVCQVISGLFVGARFYSRSLVMRALAREDYCILASWVCSSGADGHYVCALDGTDESVRSRFLVLGTRYPL